MTQIAFPNSRMSSIQMSGGIREILGRADELEKQGKSIIHMEIGRPDFDSPQCAKNAAITALNNGDVHYTDMAGTHKLREAVAEKYLKDNSMQLDPDKNIVITSGAIEALTATFLTMLEPGDEVIVPAPYFPAYADQIALANGVLVKADTTIENEFRLKVADLENSISNKSKVLLLNTPNNPSGAVLTRQDLEEIASLAIKHNLWVISDECYEKFLYEGDHISIASLPGMAERTVTISAASKTWSMTGWRVGWIVCPEQMRPFANKCHQNLTTCATSFAQAGVTEAFKHADKDVKTMVLEYKRRRDMVMKWLSRTKGFEHVIPSGAFYAFPKISSLGMDGFKFCSWLLEEAGVSTVPGEVFGSPGHIRIAYCRSYEYIEEGMRRIKEAVEKI
ncbi:MULTISPECIES: pyridoxal phosphate-dependent aminotransferase [Synergistaceae]|uniref:pyridoxal phosphate-dependent aminotransferase n=1 Tax=Synergistaceae TaxID=649777 RepID=UPI003AEEA941|nr:pyridoxal phosphate-dependent aminotransferase [Synergistaceae bacterium DZ-S4]